MTAPTEREIADRARAVVERLPVTVVACSHCPKPNSHAHDFSPAANVAVEIIATALRAERAAAWTEAAEMVDEAEWTELPHDAFPMTRTRFKLALSSVCDKLAAALRARGTSEG